MRTLSMLMRMAKKTTVVLVDDINGAEIEEGRGETVFFAIDGVSYEIDLSDTNAEQLRNALEPFVKAGRRTARANRPVAPAATSHRNNSKELAEARAWLREQGHKISDRGRIPAALLQDFRTNA
jgi:hypothetical protein